MSESLRDERVKLYSFSDTGTGGRYAPTFTYTRSYWGRKAVPGSREATLAAQASQRLDAVFILPERAVIDVDGAIRGEDGVLMKITGVQPVRNSASLVEQVVTAVYADEQGISADDDA